VNEKNDAKSGQLSGQLPDRLSTDPKSPYYDADVLARDVGIRFKGVEKTNVEEYCVTSAIRMPPESCVSSLQGAIATKQSGLLVALDCFASLAMTMC